MTFAKTSTGAYIISVDGKVVGMVRKHAAWTVRGDRISWKAYRCGKCVGTADTRAAAADLLRPVCS